MAERCNTGLLLGCKVGSPPAAESFLVG